MPLDPKIAAATRLAQHIVQSNPKLARQMLALAATARNSIALVDPNPQAPNDTPSPAGPKDPNKGVLKLRRSQSVATPGPSPSPAPDHFSSGY